MHPQILGTWPKGSQALDIGTHNLAPNNGKNDLFSQNWSKTNSKKNRLQDLYEIFNVHVLKTRWLKLVQLTLWTGILKSIFRTGRLHYITRTRFLLRQKWWCWGNLSKNVNFFLKDIHLFTSEDKCPYFWPKLVGCEYPILNLQQNSHKTNIKNY